MVLAKPENKHVSKLFDLSRKVIAVTGGTRGIGLAAAEGLAEAGANIAIIYTSYKHADSVAANLASKNNVQCAAYQSDVSIPKSIEATLQQIQKDFGTIDVVVANSGVGSHHPAEDYTEGEYRDIMKVNLDGAFYTAQAAARIFKKNGSGNIIFTASVSAALVNIPQKQAAYNASKAGLVHLARSLAVEWVDFCRVNCISPGYIATEILDIHPEEWRKAWLSMVPAQRLADPYELKGAYVFCASDASSYMTGSNLTIDGGYTLP